MDFLQTSVRYYTLTAGCAGGLFRYDTGNDNVLVIRESQRYALKKLAQRLREIAVLEYEDARDLQDGQLEKLACKADTLVAFCAELRLCAMDCDFMQEPKVLRLLQGVRAVFDTDFSEPSRDQSPLALLRDRAQKSDEWQDVIADERLRSFMMLRRCHPAVLDSDFDTLRERVVWHKLHSLTGAVTRKTAWYVKPPCECPYHYTRDPVLPNPFPQWFNDMIHRWLSDVCGDNYPDSVNLNLYEDDDHGVAWHADDERLFGGMDGDCAIISVSLGGSRCFQASRSLGRLGPRIVYDKESFQETMLSHGDVCTMEGLFQKHYIHRVPPLNRLDASRSTSPRINATFRWIKNHTGRSCPCAPSPRICEVPKRSSGTSITTTQSAECPSSVCFPGSSVLDDGVLELAADFTGLPRCCGVGVRAPPSGKQISGQTLFDSHCHSAAQGHLLSKVCDVQARMAIMGTHEDDWSSVAEACVKAPSAVPAFGLHPWFAHEARHGWEERLEELLSCHPSAIVGEVGLDKIFRPRSTGKCEYGAQQEVFRAQFTLAHNQSRPMSVHCVQSWGKMLELFQEYRSRGQLPPAIALHSWGGPPEWVQQLTRAVEPDCALFFGFSEVINHRGGSGGKRERLEANLRAVPDNRLLLESDIDAPDSVDLYMNMICTLVSKIKGWSRRHTAEVTTRNAEQFITSGQVASPCSGDA